MRMKWIETKLGESNKNSSPEREEFKTARERSGIHSHTAIEDAAILRRKREIKGALKEQLKIGKIGRKEFNILKKRMNDVSDDLVAFGSSAGIILGKKYVCGVIDKEDFEQIKCDLLPASLEEEKEYVISEIEKHKESLSMFKQVCTHDEHVCQKCHRDKLFYMKFKEAEGIKLCGGCYEIYKKHKNYSGYYGRYIISKPCKIDEESKSEFSIREGVYD